MTRFPSLSPAIRLAVMALFAMAAVCSAQTCNSSINIPDSNKTTIITAWDGNSSSVLSCGDAEMLREKLYRDQLSFLDDTQQNSASQMAQQINDGVSQLAQLQQQAASAQSAQTVAALNLTLQSSIWLYNKTELLICIFGALEAAGIPECVKTAYDFYESSKDSFEAVQNVNEAHATAVKIQALISALRRQINALGNAPIPGSITQAKYETMCRNYTQQITTDCVNSASANSNPPKNELFGFNPLPIKLIAIFASYESGGTIPPGVRDALRSEEQIMQAHLQSAAAKPQSDIAKRARLLSATTRPD